MREAARAAPPPRCRSGTLAGDGATEPPLACSRISLAERNPIGGLREARGRTCGGAAEHLGFARRRALSAEMAEKDFFSGGARKVLLLLN